MDYLEKQDGPNGQSCELLTRVPYDRQRAIEKALFGAQSEADGQDGVFRGLLWSVDVVDTLTGERTDDIDKAAADVIDPWRKRAVELYNAWYLAAFPGPKASSRTASRTPSTARTAKASATSALASSPDGAQDSP